MELIVSSETGLFIFFVCLLLRVIELFDQHPRAKEKGSLNVNFRDQDTHF